MKTNSIIFTPLPGWFGNGEHAAPMHQDFEKYEDEAAQERAINDAWRKGYEDRQRVWLALRGVS